ncbi:hypothetical protein C8R43DRAFT_1239642 [Mycena crocata]|nr:hypothetical protein C8R43DRAFT_1239642 [Mycena crocata]
MAGTKSKNPSAAPAPKTGRKRTQTAKAKAAAEAKKDKDDDSSEDSTDEVAVPSKAVLDVDWKDPNLSLSLLTHIVENRDIKRSLYPPCGPNGSTVQGGGKPKVNAQWDLFVLTFGDDIKYKDAIAACTTPKLRLAYANKIKNRLSAMAKITRDLDKSMGETGAGIQHAADIDMSVTNAFTSKWAEYEEMYPWYFEMRNLIAQRPNLVPTGLGDSTTPLASGVIIPIPTAVDDQQDDPDDPDEDNADSDAPIEWERTPGHTPEPEPRKRAFSELDDEAGSGDDYEPSSDLVSESAPIDVDDDKDDDVADAKKQPTTHRKNPAKPSTSKPAAPAPTTAPKPAKKTKLAEFGDIAKTEEKTRQKELELAALRTRQNIKTTEVKGRIVEKREDRRLEEQRGKREERMMKLKLKELKMRHTHELRIAAARTGSSSTSHAPSFFDSHSHSSGSNYTSSEPPDYTELDSLHGNALAGPSTAANPGQDIDFAAFDFAGFGAGGNQFPS